jgi:DNA-directed RNA polymerase specialized sigma24 family protein
MGHVMSSTGSVTHWLNELKTGDERAAQQALWDRYFERLAALARKKLRHLPRRAADEEDVVLSAFESFFCGVRQGRFPLLSDRNSLWPLLVTITARKACNQLKHERADKRGGGRVRGESVFAPPAESPHEGIEQVIGDIPTPGFALQVTEECQRRLDLLDDDSLRRVAWLKLSGYTVPEISRELAVVERTVERKLERIRKLWSEEHLE